MKNLIYYLLILTITIVTSCSKESVDELTPPDTTGGDNPEPVPDTPPNVITTPCDFDLSSVAANSTIVLNCVLDLKGETINLPENVTFDFEGGDIIGDGKLIFKGGKIAGQLLSSKLTIEGDVQLKDPTFRFFSTRWDDIVEGPTTSDVALKNNQELERLLNYTKSLGANTFEIGKFDAFFEITKVTSTTSDQNFYPSREAIKIPSDFHLKMSDDTVLRVFPTDRLKGGFILAFREVSNSKVSGGVLNGMRDKHTYSDGFATKERGTHLMACHSASNIEIDGVKFVDGSLGAINIASIGFTFQPHYDPTHEITIKNCTFDNNRRMSMSITDGYNIYVENNTFLNTALDSEHINGGVVGYAINIEALRSRDDEGNLILYEKAHNIFIRNNKERGSRVGGITVSIGENVTVEGNDMENKIVYSATSGTKIRNNIFVASEKSKTTPAILAAGVGETVFNNEISGNEISGYGVGIAAYTGKMKIYDNIINTSGIGIQLKDMFDSQIYNNTITGIGNSSRGISLQLTKANNIDITGNEINVKSTHLYFVELNQGAGEENYLVNVDNNSFISDASVVFSKSNGVNYSNNMTKGPVLLIDASKVDLSANNISSADFHGIALTGINTSIKTIENTINFPEGTRFECINIASSTNPGEVEQRANTCN